MLMASIAAADNNGSYDLTGDANVDLLDRDAWLAEAATANGFAAPFAVGDATLDGRVDAADLNQVGISWLGDHSAWCRGNFDAEPVVNASDLNAIGIHWLQSIPQASAAATAVPEPATSLLTMAFAAGLAILRRREIVSVR